MTGPGIDVKNPVTGVKALEIGMKNVEMIKACTGTMIRIAEEGVPIQGESMFESKLKVLGTI